MQDLEIYDCHIHLMPGNTEGPEIFRSKAREAGISGGFIFSMPPGGNLLWEGAEPMHWKDRIAHVLDFCSKLENFYPFLRLDPTEPDAVEQVEYAPKTDDFALHFILWAVCAGSVMLYIGKRKHSV